MSPLPPPVSGPAAPVYLQIASSLRLSIFDGTLPPGIRFPSERELAARFQISRPTANKVLSTLLSENLIESRKGAGTRVKVRPSLFASLHGMESFTAHARDRGMHPSTTVLTFRRLRAGSVPAPVREAFPDGAPVLSFERLRLADGRPMILEHRWVREDLVPGLTREDVAGSFYRLLAAKFGLAMTGERHAISAVLLAPAQRKLLATQAPSTALLVEGTGFVRGSEPLWYQRLYYRGDCYQLHHETTGPPATHLRLLPSPP